MATLMRTGNPALTDATFRGLPRTADGTMTLQGTVNKTGFALLVVIAGAAITWNMPSPLLMIAGAIGGLVLGVVTAFKKEWAPYTALPYAFLEGLFLGGLSLRYASMYSGIGPLAVGLTLGTLAALLFLYKSRLIRVTQNFRLGVVAAMIYLLFNEGYSAGNDPERVHLCDEAIRLARLLLRLFPTEPEMMGLTALMLLQQARLPARFDTHGEVILLEDQDLVVGPPHRSRGPLHRRQGDRRAAR